MHTGSEHRECGFVVECVADGTDETDGAERCVRNEHHGVADRLHQLVAGAERVGGDFDQALCELDGGRVTVDLGGCGEPSEIEERERVLVWLHLPVVRVWGWIRGAHDRRVDQ